MNQDEMRASIKAERESNNPGAKFRAFSNDNPHEAFKMAFADAMKHGPRNLEIQVRAPDLDDSDAVSWSIGWREVQE